MHKLAIVILNWNGSQMMQKYLGSVIQNSIIGDVIVADNASTDDSVEMLHSQFPSVRTIILDRNYGFAGGYNRALAQLADYEYFLLLNSDVLTPDKGWDKVLTDFMDNHPECASCQPKLLDLRRREAGLSTKFEYAGAAGGFIDRYGYPFCRGRIFSTVEEDNGQYDTPAYVMWATGAAMLVRSSDWFAADGLDDDFFAHNEEIDLCWRLINKGRKNACVPQSVVWHLGGATLNQGNPRKTFLNFRNNLLMLYKNLPDNELLHVMRMRWWLDRLAALQFALKLDFENANAVFKARREFKQMLPLYRQKRIEVQASMTEEVRTKGIQERTGFSILWKYYVRGVRIFSFPLSTTA